MRDHPSLGQALPGMTAVVVDSALLGLVADAAGTGLVD